MAAASWDVVDETPAADLPLVPGNIDLTNRPRVKMADGKTATVRTIGIETDRGHINIPTISDDGKVLSLEAAIGNFAKTGKHLGIYRTREAADRAAERLHQDQAALLEGGSPGKPAPVDDEWSVANEEPITVDSSFVREAQRGADRAAMTHTQAEPASVAAWGDVLSTIPAQIRTTAAGLIAGAKLREFEELQRAGVDTESVRGGIAQESGILREVAADREANTVPDMNTLQRGVQAGLVSVPVAAPALAAGILTRNPAIAAATMAPFTSADVYGRMRADGIPQELAGRHADLQGITESATELLPFAQLLARVPAGQMLLRTLAAELPGESLAQLIQGGSDYVAQAQAAGQPVSAELLKAGLTEAAKALPETWVATIVGTTLQVGGVSGVNALAQPSAPGPFDVIHEEPLQAAAGRGAQAQGAALTPETVAPDTRQPEIAPDQYFLGNRLVPGTARTLRGGYDLVQQQEPAQAAQPEAVEADDFDVVGEEFMPEVPAIERVASDPAIRQALEAMKGQTGWDQVGGRLKRAGGADDMDTSSPAIGRTEWIPRYPWYQGRPTKHNEKAVQAVIDKMLAGEKLGAQQQILATYLADVAADSVRAEPFLPDPIELQDSGLESTVGDAYETALVARASDIDDAVIERLAIRYGDDNEGFLRAVREFVDSSETAPALESGPGRVGQEARPQPALERDLFAGSDAESESLARRNAIEAEKARRARVADVPVETGNPNDLFSSARRQTDLTDQSTGASGRYVLMTEHTAKAGSLEEGTAGTTRWEADPRLGAYDTREEARRAYLVRLEPEQANFWKRASDEHIARYFKKVAGIRVARAEQVEDEIHAARSGPVARSWNPGANYVDMLSSTMPVQGRTVTIGTRANDERSLDVPEKPIRREHVMDEFQRAFGVRVYQGRPFKFRSALGYFRPKNFEVRIKNFNDLEVTAHEVFHWLDRSFPTVRALYHQPQFRDQLKAISYDQKQLLEGFAEFGRLLLTQEDKAAIRVPQFYDAFITEARRLGIYGKLRRVQDRMHQWYAQGAELRAISKIGEEPPPIRDRLAALQHDLTSRSTSRLLDYLHRAKVIEQATSGSVANDAARSLYKELRLLDHSRSVTHAVLNYGTPLWTAEGDLRFSGKGLRQIFEPVADAMDDALAYFVGMRAQELLRHGKEKLFTRDEVAALIGRGRNSPKAAEIETAFREYQEFNERMLDFAVQSGVVSDATRNLWRRMYANYVPFYRVRDTLSSGVPGQQGALFRRLTGGTQNLRDTWENIVKNAELITEASLRNHAKRKLYKGIASSPLGQKYAVAIPTDVKPVNIGMEQIETALKGLIADAQKRSQDPQATAADQAHYAQVAIALDILSGGSNMAGTGGALTELQDQTTFFLRGQKPGIDDKDFYLHGGKPVWFQIGDQELMRMLEAINSYRPLHLIEKLFGISSRILRRGVTLSPEFQIRNFLRDQMNAATLSEGGQKPFIDGMGTIKNIVTKDEAMRLFFLNGGGFGLQQAESGQALKLELERVRKANGKVNIRAILDTPAKVFEWYDTITQVSELATRVAEFKKIREKGLSLREAAFQANEVSTDFAAHGSDPVLSFIRLSVPFFGARLQGLTRLGREFHEHPVRLATRAVLMVTLPTLFLYWRNKDDERYKALTPETRALYWVLLDPRGDGVWLIPKPFEVGALFATVPEVAWNQFESGNDKQTVAAMKFMLANTFSFNPTPQVIKPPLDLARNKDFRGSPIVPEGLKDVDPVEQFTAYTPQSMVQVGRLFNVSPVKLDYLLRGYLGTLGTYAVAAADAMVEPHADNGEEPSKRSSQQPIARAFRRDEPYRSTQYEQDFYAMLEESRRVVATANHMRDTLRIPDQVAYIEAQPEAVGRADALNRAQAQASKINNAMKMIRYTPDLTADEKRAELDALQEQKNSLFREVAKTFAAELNRPVTP